MLKPQKVQHNSVRLVTVLVGRSLGTHGCPRMREGELSSLKLCNGPTWGRGREYKGGRECLMGGEMGDIPDVATCPLP